MSKIMVPFKQPVQDKGGSYMNRLQAATTWCREQFGQEYIEFHDQWSLVWTFRVELDSVIFVFTTEDQALLFKLAWGGEK